MAQHCQSSANGSYNWSANKGIAQFFNSGFPVIGEEVTQATVYLKKTNSPTGTIYVKIYQSDGTSLTLGTMGAAGLTTSYAAYTFINATGITLDAGSYLAIEYTGASGANYIDTQSQDGGENYAELATITSTNFSDPSAWSKTGTVDLKYCITYSDAPPPPSGDGGMLPPEPIELVNF
jgi:hypothetical protein